MIVSIALILLGFALLMYGGDKLVEGAVAVAKKLDMPPLVIGVVLVGFGTSVPELVTSIEAALNGAEGISIGNVIGSNIANVLLVAGAGALLIPVGKPAKGFKRDSIVMTIATVMFIASAYAGLITRTVGAMYVAFLVLYIIYTIVSERRRRSFHDAAAKAEVEEVLEDAEFKSSTFFALLVTFFGIGLTIGGAKALVMGATDIAMAFGISETVIGVTIVALGTSLPELATAVAAGLKGESDVSIGNIIGSNIYNILAILGITSLIVPLSIEPIVLQFDLWVMVAATAAMIIIPLTIKRISRITGGIFVAAYFAYLVSVYVMFVA